MVTAEELTVAIQSEGVGETQQDLEGVERAMEDTAESAGDSAEELQGFSEQFAGAMQAAVAALAIGAAGLLSQVPVLGEAFAGLGAIVDAVAFQIDSVLRPVITPITNLMFGLARAIFNLEGVASDLFGIFAAVSSIAAVLSAAVLGLIGQFVGWATAAGTLVGTLGLLANIVSLIVQSIVSFIAASTTALAAIGALIGIIITAVLEVTGLLDAFQNLGRIAGSVVPSQIVNAWLALLSPFLAAITTIGAAILGFVRGTLDGGLSEGIDRAVSNAQEALGIFVTAWKRTIDNIISGAVTIVQTFLDVGQEIAEWAAGLAQDAFEWGANVIENFIAGIESVISELQERLNELQNIAPSVDVNFPNIGGGGDGDGGGGGTPPSFRGPPSGLSRNNSIQLDGRNVTESTGRYRADPNRRRGL